ncbi:GNAT family N-acetyltransferase [Streptococcus sp. zg-JUN1979]|uniref:GNAT family N-acetyltransferase n=1 Tax=Streptococcus sp. zg-JUN1979 TaxID=3391450 RepID=UPI0039B04942
MRDIFNIKKKFTQNSSKSVDFEEHYNKLREKYLDLKRESERLTKKLERVERHNRYPEEAILFSTSHGNYYPVITVRQKLSIYWQVESLCFELTGRNERERYGFLYLKPIYKETTSPSLKIVKRLVIRDFVIDNKYRDRGFGSLLLREVLLYLVSLFGTKTPVVGSLSAVDEADLNNHMRRNHFYKKFGFEVTNGRIFLEEIDVKFLAQLRDDA